MKQFFPNCKIGVHSGYYHLDELMALSIVSLVEDKLNIIRTREEDILESCDFRIDVGNKYDPETGDFDHHIQEEDFQEYHEQPQFSKSISNLVGTTQKRNPSIFTSLHGSNRRYNPKGSEQQNQAEFFNNTIIYSI